MKKFFTLSLILMMSLQTAAFAQMITNSGLDRLERKIFQRTFTSESREMRINRLENQLFGAQQSGNLDDRFTTLNNAAKNYKNFNPNAYSNYYPYPNQTYCSQYQAPMFTYGQGSDWRRTIWNNFRNYANGTPTGITPMMDPAYMDWFEADRAAKNQYYRSNHAYRHKNSNSSSGLGVSVLD